MLSPEVAMDARGDTTVTWWAEGYVWAREHPAGRRWLVAQMVAKLRGLPASLAVDGHGDALLAWSVRGGIVAAAKRTRKAHWRTSVVVARHDAAAAQPTAAIDPNGAGVITWLNREGLNTAWNSSVFG